VWYGVGKPTGTSSEIQVGSCGAMPSSSAQNSVVRDVARVSISESARRTSRPCACCLRGTFVAGSLAWAVLFNRFKPDRFDLLGSAVCSSAPCSSSGPHGDMAGARRAIGDCLRRRDRASPGRRVSAVVTRTPAPPNKALVRLRWWPMPQGPDHHVGFCGSIGLAGA